MEQLAPRAEEERPQGILAARRAAESGRVMVHAFDDGGGIAGHGAIGLEIPRGLPCVDAVVASIGRGGLLGGIACTVKETGPRVCSWVCGLLVHLPCCAR